MEEIADGYNPGPDPAAADPGLAAAEALAQAEHRERELHSFEIEPSQVSVGPSVNMPCVLLQNKTDRLCNFEREICSGDLSFAVGLLLPLNDTLFHALVPRCSSYQAIFTGTFGHVPL